MVAGFVSSSLAVGHNAVKSILFRVAGLCLQIGVFKFFALLASAKSAFTAYLMFTEDYIQRALFVFSRGFSHHAVLVFFFTIFLLGSGLYDTLLWGLDSPGYISQKQNVTASTVKNHLLKRPGYVIFSTTKPEDLDTLDQHFMDSMNSNLFDSNLNFSLTGQVNLGTPETIPPTQKFNLMKNIGPRIWLDKEGLSVSPDTYVTTSSISNLEHKEYYICPWAAQVEDQLATWACSFDNIHADQFARGLVGRPEIHWDDVTDQNYLSEYMRPNREDNPWTFVGAGGETAMLKEMFSVTKGQRRHTFLSTVMKVSAVYNHKEPFPKDSVLDLVKRSWSPDPALLDDPRIAKIANRIEAGVSKNQSFQLGSVQKFGHSVVQLHYEYLNVVSTQDIVAFSLFRISLVNITIIRSETLPEPVKPFEPCDRYYHNRATGGKVYGTSCYEQTDMNNTGARFFGQLDSSSVLIIGSTLGDGSTNLSSKALNQNGYEWIAKNEGKLENLVLSRGYIMAIDPSLVGLEISKVQAAMSPLQVLLVILPIVFCAIIWGLLWRLAESHYASSLLANLYATTNVGDTNTSADPGYIYKMPDINFIKKDGKVQMATASGVFIHHEPEAMENMETGYVKVQDPRGSYTPIHNAQSDESSTRV
ncbi:uncharacterized protein GIQ15_04607 [Arthroderma uncinatum]|uniref:uncharacterized protein n=1 Tax=Arthroderma uncinatum TaxID=74035 RepID=UPI00144AF52A|nr:uncharacterized protein GIQ15_04607 [Arthroderma uncinatum]KAF3481848.1 hypothetical protein GIQ15_04607 [Arthroderma uncinatum]